MHGEDLKIRTCERLLLQATRDHILPTAMEGAWKQSLSSSLIPETPDCNLVRDPEVEDILSQARNPDPQKL
jgi:hypothetical protein